MVSPQRSSRPWGGALEEIPQPPNQTFDSQCYLYPGNSRVNESQNPRYSSLLVFDNDFAVVVPTDDAPERFIELNGIIQEEAAKVLCRVICYSPHHDGSFATFTVEEIRAVIDEWARQYEMLSKLSYIKYILIFENKGLAMGD